MFLPNVDELISMARRGFAPEQVFGPDRPRIAARLHEAREAVSGSMNTTDWGSDAYATHRYAYDVLTAALSTYAEYADKEAAYARA